MNLLLDTHIWVWSHVEPERLGKRVAAALAEERNECWLSPISIWEFLLLAERGRVRVKDGMTASEWVEAALDRAPMHDAALNREVAVRSRSIRIEGDDPADRFLAATADVYELTLVTADERLLRSPKLVLNEVEGQERVLARRAAEWRLPAPRRAPFQCRCS